MGSTAVHGHGHLLRHPLSSRARPHCSATWFTLQFASFTSHLCGVRSHTVARRVCCPWRLISTPLSLRNERAAAQLQLASPAQLSPAEGWSRSDREARQKREHGSVGKGKTRDDADQVDNKACAKDSLQSPACNPRHALPGMHSSACTPLSRLPAGSAAASRAYVVRPRASPRRERAGDTKMKLSAGDRRLGGSAAGDRQLGERQRAGARLEGVAPQI